MTRPLSPLKETASQTAGPFVHIGLAPSTSGTQLLKPEFGNTVAGPDVPGEPIAIEGIIYDGEGTPVRDAVLESWQADGAGRYAHPEAPDGGSAFRGFGRMACDFETGLFTLRTIKPGPVPGRNGTVQAPHINLWIMARGINIGLQTRLYFSDEVTRNTADPVLSMIPSANRRETLIANKSERDGNIFYRFDIHLQGERETVFFDV